MKALKLGTRDKDMTSNTELLGFLRGLKQRNKESVISTRLPSVGNLQKSGGKSNGSY